MRGGRREGERVGEGSRGYGTDTGENGTGGGGERREIRRDEKKNKIK